MFERKHETIADEIEEIESALASEEQETEEILRVVVEGQLIVNQKLDAILAGFAALQKSLDQIIALLSPTPPGPAVKLLLNFAKPISQ